MGASFVIHPELFFVYLVTLLAVPGFFRWVVILVATLFLQVPYLLASLSLRQVDDGATRDALGLKRDFCRLGVPLSAVVAIVQAVCDLARKSLRRPVFPVAILVTFLVASAVMATAIWLINGGGDRLLRPVRGLAEKAED